MSIWNKLFGSESQKSSSAHKDESKAIGAEKRQASNAGSLSSKNTAVLTIDALTKLSQLEAFVVSSTGNVREVLPRKSKFFDRDEIHGYTNGGPTFETLNLPAPFAGKVMVLNEEGKLKNLQRNEIATFLANRVIGANDYIAGDVLVCNLLRLGLEHELSREDRVKQYRDYHSNNF